MKLKSLLLGSVAAAGLSTGAFAADLASVVSSFDVCEQTSAVGLTHLRRTTTACRFRAKSSTSSTGAITLVPPTVAGP